MKVLVAGATGYLGRFVVQEFKRRGYWVRALEASVAKFLYVSVYNAQLMEHVAIVKAHELAFSILGKPARITHIPAGLASAAIGAMGLFNRHAADLFDFFTTAGRFENVAPCFGTHALDEYFRELSRLPAER